MLDVRIIRDETDRLRRGLAAKRVTIDVDQMLALDKQRREIVTRVDELRAEQNRASEQIGARLKAKEDAAEAIAAMRTIKTEIDRLEVSRRQIDEAWEAVLLTIPNIPHESVPVGGADANAVVRSWGEAPSFGFSPKNHIELAESLGIIDFKRATKISGSNFILFTGMGARLERALYNFMLDVHTSEHGYTEVLPPFVVNTASMTATGQLPKMAEDMYKCRDDDLWLIPTAEVPVTNIHRDEILAEEDLPISYTGYTGCFRREAGSYGKETRGLVRVHQFDKVEMVKFVHPDRSYDELESLVGNAETILQRLGLPYRVLMLASGDLSFAAAKCYDLEAYSVGMGQWLEVSSCSNFEDFQARRANIRFKPKGQKRAEFVHTLNGSGLALARVMVAILENYQTAAGEVVVPEVLRPYLGGCDTIKRK